MRRKDREMPAEFAFRVVDKCAYATLALADKDGNPYCIPLSIVREGEKIFFHCAHAGLKVDLLRANPQVCISCVGEIAVPKGEFSLAYESAVLFGQAEEVHEDEQKTHALRLLSERFTPANMANFEQAIAESLRSTAVWQVTISSISGKANMYRPKHVQASV